MVLLELKKSQGKKVERIEEKYDFDYDRYYKKVIKNYVYYSGKRLLA